MMKHELLFSKEENVGDGDCHANLLLAPAPCKHRCIGELLKQWGLTSHYSDAWP